MIGMREPVEAGRREPENDDDDDDEDSDDSGSLLRRFRRWRMNANKATITQTPKMPPSTPTPMATVLGEEPPPLLSDAAEAFAVPFAVPSDVGLGEDDAMGSTGTDGVWEPVTADDPVAILVDVAPPEVLTPLVEVALRLRDVALALLLDDVGVVDVDVCADVVGPALDVEGRLRVLLTGCMRLDTSSKATLRLFRVISLEPSTRSLGMLYTYRVC
jgi:hypothetical protein